MTNEQLALYLRSLAGQLSGIVVKIEDDLEGVELERYPETYKSSIFIDMPQPHPHANKPVCLDDLRGFIGFLHHSAEQLVGFNRAMTQPRISDEEIREAIRRQL